MWLAANKGPFDGIVEVVRRDVRSHAEAGTEWALDDSVERPWTHVMVVPPYSNPDAVKRLAPQPLSDRQAEWMKLDDGGTALIFFTNEGKPDLVYIDNGIVLFDVDLTVLTPVEARFTVRRNGELTSGAPLYEARLAG